MVFPPQERKKKGKTKFFEWLDKKFDLAFVNDKSDIEMLKSAFEREVSTVYSLAPLLEDYLVYLGERGKRGSQESQLSKRYKIIKEIIAAENVSKPYAGIPEEERRLLIALNDAIQLNKKESISFNLNELSSVLSARSKDYERAMNANRWAKLIAIIGVATSIIFGVFALLK